MRKCWKFITVSGGKAMAAIRKLKPFSVVVGVVLSKCRNAVLLSDVLQKI